MSNARHHYPAHEPVAIRLLELKSVQDNASILDNLPLRTACKYGRKPIVEKLLQIDQVTRKAAADPQAEALFEAAENGHWDIVELFKAENIPALLEHPEIWDKIDQLDNSSTSRRVGRILNHFSL